MASKNNTDYNFPTTASSVTLTENEEAAILAAEQYAREQAQAFDEAAPRLARQYTYSRSPRQSVPQEYDLNAPMQTNAQRFARLAGDITRLEAQLATARGQAADVWRVLQSQVAASGLERR